MKLLFIHRSVGRNLIKEGNLRGLLSAQNIDFDDYDNNAGELTRTDGSVIRDAITIPGNNTNPDNLAAYFRQWDSPLNEYDCIMVKSCYPNSHIKDEAHLQAIKQSYNDIFEAFRTHHKRFIVLTSPPLRPLFTNRQEARLASKLADWLVGSAGRQLKVFDFHRLLAEESGRHAGMLSSEYKRLLPFDNHPNRKASEVVAPKVATFIVEAAV